jgi:hypothetical protein
MEGKKLHPIMRTCASLSPDQNINEEFKRTLLAVCPTSIYTFHSDTNTDVLAHTQNHRTSTDKLSLIIILLLKQEWAGTATCYGFDGSGIDYGEQRDFQHPPRPGPGAHPASCTMGTGSLSLR